MNRDFFLEGVSQKIPISKIRYAFEHIFEPHLIRDIICHLHNEGDYSVTMDVSIHLSHDYIHGAEEFFQEIRDKGFVEIQIGRQMYKVHVNAWTSFPVITTKYITAETYNSMRYPSLYIERVVNTDWHIYQLFCYLFGHPSNVYSTRFILNEDGTYALFIHPKQNMPGTSKIRKMYKNIEEKGFIPFDFESHKARLPLKDRYVLETGNFIYTYRIIFASDAPLRNREKIKGFRKTKTPMTQ
jgi:hypothetical protein